MANQEHLDILKQGADVWNKWRRRYPDIEPNLVEANLSFANLRGFDLTRANLGLAHLEGTDLSNADLSEANMARTFLREATFKGANLSKTSLIESDLIDVDLRETTLVEANLYGADLDRANLSRINLSRTNLNRADLTMTNLQGANLSKASLIGTLLRDTNLSEANLSRADLRGAIFLNSNLSKANIAECHIHGISVWNARLEDSIQKTLIITEVGEPIITVDNLEVAQFIYLLLNNRKIREVIDTITSKVVLILGRFAPERKAVLDAIREALRKLNYSPVLFDFEKPSSRDITETVSILAHMARFVIADITEPKSIPQELSHIIPFLPSVPIIPLLQISEREYGMYEHFISYPWVQPIYHYHDLDELLQSIQEHVIEPAEKRVRELAIEKAKRLERP